MNKQRWIWSGSLIVVLSLILGWQPGAASGKTKKAVSDDLWNRTHRVFAYNAPRRARYPSLARNKRGELVLLFTQISKEQEEAGLGDVMMIYSTDKGETWSPPEKIYEGTIGEPRTMGTLVTLASGKLVAAVAEINKEGKPKEVRLLTSRDEGRNWRASAPLDFPGVKWASPYGRLIEQGRNTLLMPVETELPAGKASVGLLRSTDGGKTWEDLSPIASDPEKSFSQPAVLATGEESMVALVKSGGGLYRCESLDKGYHWTEPLQVLLGRELQLVRIDDRALVCLYSQSQGSTWGWIFAGFSYDAGRSWRCDRKVMEHPGEPGGHFGWPTGLALDPDHLIVVFGHTQLPSSSMDAPATRSIAEEEERIEVVFFERDREAPELPLADWSVPPEKRDRWEQTGPAPTIPKMTCLSGTPEGDLIGISDRAEGTGYKFWRSSDRGSTWEEQPMNLPPGFRGDPNAVTQLSSGRLLCVIQSWLRSTWLETPGTIIGKRGGYSIWNPDRQFVLKTKIYVIYSDDRGKTWQGTEKPMDISPLDWSNPCHFFEQADGTVVMLTYGCLSEEDTRIRLDVVGIFRSTDQGQSWGDFSLIAYDKEERSLAYNEIGIAPMNEKLWVAIFRTDPRRTGNQSSWMSRAISTDGGYTWSPPELCFGAASPQIAILPDGGIAVRTTRGMRFTYDLGRTWTRIVPCGGYPHNTILLDDDTFLSGSGPFWKRIPAAK